MSHETAIWYPFWYELDQSLEVGSVDDFDFFCTPPEQLAGETRLVFYFGDCGERDRYHRQRKKIVSIRHAALGDIKKIDAKGLDYTFTMTDGRALKVEAEETPGLVYAHPEPIADWRVYVEMESA